MVCTGEMGSIVDKKSWYEEDTKSQRKPTKKYDSQCQQAYQTAKKGKDVNFVSFRIRGSGCISVWAFDVGDFDY